MSLLVKHLSKRQQFQQAAVVCFIYDAGVGQFAFRPHIATTALNRMTPVAEIYNSTSLQKVNHYNEAKPGFTSDQ